MNKQLSSSAQATKGKDPAAQNITNNKRGHPILTSQGGKNDRNETRNRARISTQGQWRPSSGGDEDVGRGKEGRRDAHLDLDRGKAARRGGEGGGEALRGEDAAGPWNGTMGEGQSGLRPSR